MGSNSVIYEGSLYKRKKLLLLIISTNKKSIWTTGACKVSSTIINKWTNSKSNGYLLHPLLFGPSFKASSSCPYGGGQKLSLGSKVLPDKLSIFRASSSPLFYFSASCNLSSDLLISLFALFYSSLEYLFID